MTVSPDKSDHKSYNKLNQEKPINEHHSSSNNQTKETKKNGDRGKCISSLCNSLRDWLQGEAGIAFVGIIATLLWNYQMLYNTTKSHSSELINNYINSIKELILDQYHHGKDEKFPEISVEEVEAFIRAKTSNTLKALDKTKSPSWPTTKIPLLPFVNQTIIIEKQNLVNFLNEAGIGFFKPVQMKEYQYNFIQNVCGENNTLGYGKGYQPKDNTFHHFFCEIDLRDVDLETVGLDGIILEKANLQGTKLKGASLWQANLQEAVLYNSDLSDANLTKTNLKKAWIVGANLENATLNQANLRGVWAWQPLVHQPEDCERDPEGYPGGGSKIKCNDAVQANKPASFRGAKLVGANLQDANLREVDFSNAKMSPFFLVDQYSILKGKKEKISRIIPTNLRDANLRDANLRGADLREANLRGADLTSAKFLNNRKTIFSWNLELHPGDLRQALYDHNTKLPFSEEKADKIAEKLGMIKISWGFDLKNENLSDVDLRLAFRCKNERNEYKEKNQITDKHEWVKCDPSKIKLTHYTNIDLTRADLRGADLSQVTIDEKTKLKLKGALFDEETNLPLDNKTKLAIDEKKAEDLGMIKLGKLIPGADLKLRGKDLSYTDLSGVNLSNSQLQGTDLSNIDFDEHTKLLGAEYNQKPHHKRTKLPFDRNTAVLYEMKLIVDPTAEESQPVNWGRADLRLSILRDCEKEDDEKCLYKNLDGANLQRAKLAYADWQDANLSNANLQEANLTNINLKGANLTNANLQGANLNFAQLDGATICNTTPPDKKYEWPKDVNKECKNDDTSDRP